MFHKKNTIKNTTFAGPPPGDPVPAGRLVVGEGLDAVARGGTEPCWFPSIALYWGDSCDDEFDDDDDDNYDDNYGGNFDGNFDDDDEEEDEAMNSITFNTSVIIFKSH